MCGTMRARLCATRAATTTLAQGHELVHASQISADCRVLRRTLSVRGKPHNADGSTRMMETHLDLAHVQYGDEERVPIRHFVRRHFAKVSVSLEVPHTFNAERMAEECLGVDDTSRSHTCLYLFLLKSDFRCPSNTSPTCRQPRDIPSTSVHSTQVATMDP